MALTGVIATLARLEVRDRLGNGMLRPVLRMLRVG